jgi:hypothetical protein
VRDRLAAHLVDVSAIAGRFIRDRSGSCRLTRPITLSWCHLVATMITDASGSSLAIATERNQSQLRSQGGDHEMAAQQMPDKVNHKDHANLLQNSASTPTI